MGRSLILSATFLQQILKCPQSIYLTRLQRPEGYIAQIDYPRLLGQAVHQFIQMLYKGNYHDRSYFYKSFESARSAWFYLWNKLNENPPKPIKYPDNDQKNKYGGIGWVCITNYWKQNISKPRPIEIERRLKFNTFYPGLSFVGIIDQIRVLPLDVIAKLNPNIIVGDRLHNGYLPEVIIDLKTSKHSWDITHFDPEATFEEMADAQAELHKLIQITAYYWLYKQWRGKLPAGAFIYHLRSGKYFYTSRKENDFQNLNEQIKHTIGILNSGVYPKNPSDLCRYCDALPYCDEGRRIYVPSITDLTGSCDINTNPYAIVNPQKSKQLRFNLDIPR